MSYNQSDSAMATYRNVGLTGGVIDADPHELISLLMQGVLDSCARARGVLDEAEPTPRMIAQKGEQVGRAISILETLRTCLDHDAGGDVSGNLDKLYEYMSMRLLRANATNSIAWIEEVAGLMREIKAGWDAIPDDARAARKAAATGSRLEGADQALGSC